MVSANAPGRARGGARLAWLGRARAGLLALCTLWPALAQAELTISITRGQQEPTRIAISPFAWEGMTPPESVADTIRKDLGGSGRFAALPLSEMLSRPTLDSPISFYEWRRLDVDYVLVGKISRVADGAETRYRLYDISQEKAIVDERVLLRRAKKTRAMAHHISDSVYEAITGIQGVFNSRMLYVLRKRGNRQDRRYQLIVSDVDGANAQAVLASNQPIISPAWSPDAKKIAYVSFEQRRPVIYVQTLHSGTRRRVAFFPGLNSAPAWSPDGRHLAMVLSKDGNPDIHIMRLSNGRLTRVAPHFGIDTEPAWMPDGRSIVFTSDRGGTPQIYQINLRTQRIRRLTFRGSYNARAKPLPNGRGIIFVHGRSNNFHVALLDMERNRTRVLTRAQLDESPTIAPNSNILIYAARRGGRSMLVALSLDGSAGNELISLNGDVSEPSWSPRTLTEADWNR